MNLRKIIQVTEALHKIICIVYFLLYNILVVVELNYGEKSHQSDCLWGDDG